jgi:hypothetical protein
MVQVKLVLAGFAAFLLTACVIGGDSASATYHVGYADGCASAGTAPRRDNELFGVDPDYRAGWQSGRSTCTR